MAQQIKSASEATKWLFEVGLNQLPITEFSRIEEEVKYYVESWKSPGLIKGDQKSLYGRVLKNLEYSTFTSGFKFFAVEVIPAHRVAQVMSFSDGNAASVCLFRAEQDLYICGNKYFS